MQCAVRIVIGPNKFSFSSQLANRVWQWNNVIIMHHLELMWSSYVSLRDNGDALSRTLLLLFTCCQVENSSSLVYIYLFDRYDTAEEPKVRNNIKISSIVIVSTYSQYCAEICSTNLHKCFTARFGNVSGILQYWTVSVGTQVNTKSWKKSFVKQWFLRKLIR